VACLPGILQEAKAFRGPSSALWLTCNILWPVPFSSRHKGMEELAKLLRWWNTRVRVERLVSVRWSSVAPGGMWGGAGEPYLPTGRIGTQVDIHVSFRTGRAIHRYDVALGATATWRAGWGAAAEARERQAVQLYGRLQRVIGGFKKSSCRLSSTGQVERWAQQQRWRSDGPSTQPDGTTCGDASSSKWVDLRENLGGCLHSQRGYAARVVHCGLLLLW
jgi:hypothetical protein